MIKILNNGRLNLEVYSLVHHSGFDTDDQCTEVSGLSRMAIAK